MHSCLYEGVRRLRSNDSQLGHSGGKPIGCEKANHSEVLASLAYSVCLAGHFGSNILRFVHPDAHERVS